LNYQNYVERLSINKIAAIDKIAAKSFNILAISLVSYIIILMCKLLVASL